MNSVGIKDPVFVRSLAKVLNSENELMVPMANNVEAEVINFLRFISIRTN
jgi:hypothetical protein